MTVFLLFPCTQVAITGCPQAQERHVERMVLFARDCLAKTNVLVAELSETLGEDTNNLEFRIGIHSGPVTGGTLHWMIPSRFLSGDVLILTEPIAHLLCSSRRAPWRKGAISIVW